MSDYCVPWQGSLLCERKEEYTPVTAAVFDKENPNSDLLERFKSSIQKIIKVYNRALHWILKQSLYTQNGKEYTFNILKKIQRHHNNPFSSTEEWKREWHSQRNKLYKSIGTVDSTVMLSIEVFNKDLTLNRLTVESEFSDLSMLLNSEVDLNPTYSSKFSDKCLLKIHKLYNVQMGIFGIRFSPRG